jgi:eukaryotic-like serine/threonine-protein kinase
MSPQIQIVNARPLNAGGNGDLFRGQRNDTGEYVVIKYLREYNSPHARRSFRREIRVLRREYRGVVRLLAADTECERPYYVMPYLSGGSLATYAGRLSESQLVAVAIYLALTLADVHARFDAHGDIKPDNILVSDDGQLHVADPLGNGINCTIVFAQNHGGTPGYWPPEISAGGAVSSAGDVYSYGATLYHLATGQRPPDGERLDPSSKTRSIPPKIRETVAACCQHNPCSRPNMQEVLRILRGENWMDIQAAKQRAQGIFKAACIIGGLCFLCRSLTD